MLEKNWSVAKFCLLFGNNTYMSRIGKKLITIPENTTVTLDNGLMTVVGPKGTLTRMFRDEVAITIDNGIISFLPRVMNPFTRALWGTHASHVENLIAGVTEGFTKKLIIEGVGFKSEVSGGNLVLALGFSHPVIVPIPAGLTVTAEKNVITISGIDKEQVGQFTASVRTLKKPEPYKGKGIRYDSEIIRRKQGKKSA